MASSFIGRIDVKSKSIGTTRRKIERNEMNAIVLYPTFRIRFELLKKMQERENNMSKIMLYINAINGGGAERVMVNLAKCFSENGYETIVRMGERIGKCKLPKRA